MVSPRSDEEKCVIRHEHSREDATSDECDRRGRCDTDPMHDLGIQFYIDLESRVWDALTNGDADADLELLSADFVGVYPTGFASRADHVAQLADGPSMASYSITEAKLIEVSGDAAMLCYRADYQRPQRSVGESMFISSLWLRKDGRWQNTFSQDSPAHS